MDVVVGFDASPEEREAIRRRLGPVSYRLPDADARAMLSFWPRTELRAADCTWDDLPRLELVQLITAGANHVGWSDLPPRIQVATTPGSTGDAIAEYVLGAVIAWARGFQRHTANLRAGRFHRESEAIPLQGLRVGLVGMGGLGSRIADLLSQFGCDVAAVSKHGGDRDGVRWWGTMSDLLRLAEESQVLVVCVPLVRDTLGIIDERVLMRLQAPSLLVNVARGPLVRERDLYAWLAGDALGRHAHLDVWWDYPRDGNGRPYTEPFQDLLNVTMTPHNSSSLPGWRLRMVEAACEVLRGYLETGQPRHVVDAAAHTGIR